MRIFLITFLLPTLLFSQEFNFHSKLRNSPKKIIKDYDKALLKYKKKFCKPGLEKKYDELFTDYQGDGIYIPYMDDGQIDVLTIRENLHLLRSKKKWIKSKRDRLNKYFRLPKLEEGLSKLENLIETNLKIKYEFDVLRKKDSETISKGKKSFKALRDFYRNFEQKFFYMHNFGYPADHYENRKNYELAKIQKNRKMINTTFFKRKVYEDGAPSSSVYKKDTFPRTIIDSIKLEIEKNQIFVNNNLQYDLEWLMTTLPKLHGYGLVHYKNAFSVWEEKVSESLKFYIGILEETKKNRKFASSKFEATNAIKKYVNTMLADVYDYWTEQNELNRSLFVLETILFNEVGSIDLSGQERKEVIEVVLNRYYNPTYNSLDKNQDIIKYIKTKNPQDYRWLNVFLKEREFSFTYYFIPAVVNIFCPPRTKWGKQLRESNLYLSIDALKNYELKPESQRAIRYFSRASMIGRIDMAPIWSGHRQLPEKLGPKVEKRDDVLRALAQQDFKYRYTFLRDKKKFSVYKVLGQKYAVSHAGKETEVYRYRDPHFFRFFSL